MKNKFTQKAAFVISMSFWDNDRSVTPSKVRSHKYPLCVLIKIKDVIEFLSRYTDYQKYMNDDILKMKEDLKNGCFVIDITNMKRLEDEILNMDYPDIHEHMKESYSEHRISVHRIPRGIYKRQYLPDYIE